MEALLAIAALCSINGGMSTNAIEGKQLQCQQELVKCYFDKGKGLTWFDPSGKSPEASKFLHECVLERKIKTVTPPQPPYGG